jgi:hypothetical protein
LRILFAKSFSRPGLVAAVAGLAVASCSGEDAPANGEPIKVTAAQLSEAYDDSEPAAQRKYGIRSMVVTGTVTGFTTDAMDHVVIRMRGADQYQDVYLTLADEEKKRAGDVKRGSELVLRCERATLILGSPTLDGCSFPKGT